MNKYTSVETSKELYEAFPDWNDTESTWFKYSLNDKPSIFPVNFKDKDKDTFMTLSGDREFSYPAYEIHYLLDKIPPVIKSTYDKQFKNLQINYNGDGSFHIAYVEPYDKEFRGEYISNSSDSLAEALGIMSLQLKGDGLI